MQRVTNEMIVRRVHRMQKEGMDISVDGAYGRFAITNKEESRKLSSRCSNREILDLLDIYEQGFDAGRRSCGTASD